MKDTANVPTEIWTFEELGAFLKMTRRQLYNLTRARGQARMADPLPVLRINGNVRFRRCDVEAWLERIAKGGSPRRCSLLPSGAEYRGRISSSVVRQFK